MPFDLQALPSWLIIITLVVVILLVSYAVFTGRAVDFWVIKISEAKAPMSWPKLRSKFKRLQKRKRVEEMILRKLWNRPGGMKVEDIARAVGGINRNEAEVHLTNMKNDGLVAQIRDSFDSIHWKIEHPGSEYYINKLKNDAPKTQSQ